MKWPEYYTVRKMIYLLLVLNFTAFATAVLRRGVCDACLDSACYSKTQIFKDYPVSGQLAIDRKENLVYFHYEVSDSGRTVAFDLDDIRFLTIPDIEFSFAKTVDPTTGDVYIGGATGIYKYNPKTNVTSVYALNDKAIWNMQFKDVLYYTIVMNKGLNIYENKRSRSVTALNDFVVDDFIIDKKDNIYFMSNFTMYKLKKGDKYPSEFSNILYSLSTDVHGNAYFVQRESRGLYKIDYGTGRLVEMGAFGSGIPLKSVFDRLNNVIYYDAESSKLYYLVPNYAICKVKTETDILGKLKMKVSQI
ncbi:unnamed protein product [Arctia plantaginis]|uniref:Ommochrome-binding protein-like n=1 Tax=Arctia plantaginis TaxID=874455 RepID=A0A8S1AFN4_ARCPL|nr:unnamed protein product [Arctia plantaginis]